MKNSMYIVKYISWFFLIVFLSFKTFAEGLPPPPEVSSTDEAGVDVISGYPSFSLNDISIGNEVSSLSHQIASYGAFFWGFNDSFDIEMGIQNNGGYLWRQAVVGSKSQSFLATSGSVLDFATYRPLKNDGATLEQIGTDVYKYTMSDGTVAIQNAPYSQATYTDSYANIIYPNGYTIKVYKRNGRIQSVVSNTGLQFKYYYRSNVLPANPTGQERVNFLHPSSIMAINNSVDYCDPKADTCAITGLATVNYSWPTYAMHSSQSGGSAGTFTVTDALGRTTSYNHKFYSINMKQGDVDVGPPYETRITSVKSNTSKGISTSTYDYAHSWVCIQATGECTVLKQNVVYKMTKGGAIWDYSYPYNWATLISVGSSSGSKGNHSVTMNTGTLFPRITNVSTPDSISAQFNDNDSNLISHANVKGHSFDYLYDSRNNLVKVTEPASSGSSEAGQTKITEAYYPNPESSTCSNLKTCNKPTWVRDAKGNQTDYTYYEEHGGVKTVISPADASGVRPTTWYKYEQKYAWYKKNSNTIERADAPVWLLTEERTCTQGNANVSADTCVDPTKLLITRYNYGGDGVPNNLWKRGVEVISYNKTLRTCYQYDYYGNVIAETQPKAGLSSCE